MARRISLSMPVVDPVLDREEQGLVYRALEWLRKKRPGDSGVLWGQLKRVAMLGAVLEQAPSLYLETKLGRSTWDETTLIEHLSRLDPLEGDLRLPERAVVARAFLMAKMSLLRGFLTALGPGAPGEEPELSREFRRELAQSIYTLLATEILLGLVSDGALPERTRRCAARQLILIWDRALKVEIDDFCPLLESAWRARARLRAKFGTLLGTGEYLALIEENCSPDFLEFFTRDGVSEGEEQAFEEFLFALTYEDITRLRATMRQEGLGVVDAEFVARVLQRPHHEVAAFDDPEEFCRSYRRRRGAAEFRRLTRSQGPLRVAEAYIMIFVLDTQTAPS